MNPIILLLLLGTCCTSHPNQKCGHCHSQHTNYCNPCCPPINPCCPPKTPCCPPKAPCCPPINPCCPPKVPCCPPINPCCPPINPCCPNPCHHSDPTFNGPHSRYNF